MRVYVAGPLTNGGTADAAAALWNRRAFAIRGLELTLAGHAPLLPTLIELPPDVAWEDAMCECLRHLAACDAVSLLPGWQDSLGARLERALALRWNMPVFEGLPEPAEGAS